MKKTTFLLTFALLLAHGGVLSAGDLNFVQPHRVGLSADRLDKIESVILDAVDQGEIPHGAVLVARNGKIAYLEYFGDADSSSEAPLREDTIFRVASMTKAVTSVAAMMMYEEGKFLMNDPLSKYIPAFIGSQVAEVNGQNITLRDPVRPITVRDVLTHQAGMIYQPFITGPLADLYQQEGVAEFFPFARDESLESYINRYASTPMFTDPGGVVTYGVATDVLGRLVEVWSGQSLQDFFQSRIFTPLGMEDTHFFLPLDKAHRLTTMYTSLADGSYEVRNTPEVTTFLAGPRRLYGGAAGLLSTPTDYFRFCQMLLNKGKFNGIRLLGPKSVEMMSSDQLGGVEFPDFLKIMGDVAGFGFGIRTQRGEWDGLESLGTLSFAGIYWTRYWIDPKEDLIVLCFTQVFTLDQSGWAHKVKNAAYQSLIVQ